MSGLLHSVAVMNEREITMNIFDCAIKMEQEARIHYEKLSDSATIPEMKNLFTLLAESEQEHYDALVKIKESPDSLDATFKEFPERVSMPFQTSSGKT
jgi:rubrerythrin